MTRRSWRPQRAPSPNWPAGVYGPATATGVSFAVSMIRAGDVTDGLSSTYLLGEKNMDPDHYTDGNQGGDNEWALAGFDYNTYRFADHNLKSGAIYAINDPRLKTMNYTSWSQDMPGPYAGYTRLRIRPLIRRPTPGRRQHGDVRRIGPHDRLQHRYHGPNSPLQPLRRHGDRRETVLTGANSGGPVSG